MNRSSTYTPTSSWDAPVPRDVHGVLCLAADATKRCKAAVKLGVPRARGSGGVGRRDPRSAQRGRSTLTRRRVQCTSFTTCGLPPPQSSRCLFLGAEEDQPRTAAAVIQQKEEERRPLGVAGTMGPHKSPCTSSSCFSARYLAFWGNETRRCLPARHISQNSPVDSTRGRQQTRTPRAMRWITSKCW